MRLRVAIDARPAVAYHGKTGVGYYTQHLIELLPRIDPELTLIAWYLNLRAVLPSNRHFTGLRLPNLVERWTPIPSYWFERSVARLGVPRIEWFARFDVLFAPNYVPPPSRTRRLVLTVHDLAFRLFPDTASHATLRWLEDLDAAVHRAARVITVSEATRRDVLEAYSLPPERVTAIPLGVDLDLFRPSPAEEIRAVRTRFRIQGPYLLSVGGIEPRKNLPALVRAFARLPSDLAVSLVLAGSSVPWNPEGRLALQAALEELPPEVRRRVVLTGYVSDREKVALLGGAVALVFPSLYEGFGLPVLEAMACMTPVLTSNVSALPEVAGDAALLVDPRDEEAITAGMERLLRDEALRGRLQEEGRARASGWSWTETARRTLEVLREVGGR